MDFSFRDMGRDEWRYTGLLMFLIYYLLVYICLVKR